MQRPGRAPSNGGRAAPVALPPVPTERGTFLPSLLVWLLFLIMSVPQGLQYSDSTTVMPTEGDAISITIWLVLLFGGFYLMIRHLNKAKLMLENIDRFFLAFVVLATLSVLWSIEPSFTIRRIRRLYTIAAVCIGFTVIGWNATRFQSMLRNLLTAICLASLIFVKLDPQLAIHWVPDHPELYNAWHGITVGKNILGSLASTATVLWIHALLSRQQHWLMCLAGASLAIVNLFGTKSSTSLMATIFAVMFMLLLLRSPGAMRRIMPYVVTIFAGVILIYALAVLRLVPGLEVVLAPITLITGKDLTFTGRTDIWYVLGLHIHFHPWFGTGYGAYWIGPNPSSPSYDMVRQLYFYPTEGHNGYLDVINDLGYVGLITLLGYFYVYVRQSLDLMKVDRYQGALYLTLIFRGFLADMSETHWFSVLSIDFVVMTLATAALGRSLLAARQQRQAQAVLMARARSAPARAMPAMSPAAPVSRPATAGGAPLGPLSQRLRR